MFFSRKSVIFTAATLFLASFAIAGCTDQPPDTSAPERIEIDRSGDWQGALLYIADQNGPTPDWGSVRVYDNVSGFVEKTVEQTTAAAPSDMFVTPDGSSMYVASGLNGAIEKFRWNGNNWIDSGQTIDTPAAVLTALVPGPDGMVYVTGKESSGAGAIYSLDPAQDRSVKGLATFQDTDVSGLTWSRDGSRLFIAFNLQNQPRIGVTQWPFSSSARIDETPVPVKVVHEVVTSPDGRFVYAMGRGGISVIDAASNAVSGSLKPAPEPDADYYDAAFSADGKYMFTAATPPGGDGTLYVIELSTGNVVHTVKHISVKPNGIQRTE